MTALASGAGLAWSRARGMWWLIALSSAAAFVSVAAAIERQTGGLGAVDRALVGSAFGVVVPILVYAAVGRALGHRALVRATLELARHGVHRRRATLGMLLATTASMSLVCGLLAALAVFIARGSVGAPVLSDALTSGWIGMLAGAAYTWWFAAGGLGGTVGRLAMLAADWLLGSTGTFAAAFCPRGHVLNLLGADAPLGAPQWVSALGLGALLVLAAAAALGRTPR